MLPRALATNTTSLLRRGLTTSTSTRSSQIVPTSTKHLFAPRALSSYSASAIASRFHAATWKPPPPPPPPPGLKEKLVVLFPRQGSRQTTIEVKKRILRSCPHMGGRRLKRLVRMHARKGNSNSFVADFESRLDRVLYRCNAVPSIFAARMAIGHKHVMVNGKITNSTHYLMKPGDVVEPAPGSLPLFERFLRRRLANNSFVFAKDGQPSPQKQIAPPKTPTIQANFGQLLADGAAVAATYRRLPPPREAGGGGGGGGAAASASGGASATAAAPLLTWPAGRQAQLDAIVPSLLVALAGEGSGLASEVAKRRGELSVVAPPQPARRGTAPPAATLAWQPDAPPTGSGSKALLTLDRVRLRRLLLGLLALRPA